MPKVSVIVPIYNTEKFLEECLNSILNQSFKDIEIILVNDGSKDNSYNIIEDYKQKDNRIQTIHKENGGLWSARNAGLKLAKGQYISFIDSDDWIKEDMLDKMYNEIEKQCADLAVCNYNKVYNDQVINDRLRLKNEIIDIKKIGIKDYFYYYFFPYIHGHEVCNKLYKKEIVVENNILFEKNSEIFSEDILFNLYYLCHINKICALNISFYNYIQHDSSIMNNRKPQLVIRYTELIKRFALYMKKNNLYSEVEKVIPVMLYNLVSRGLYEEYCTSQSLKDMAKAIKDISKFEIFKPYFKELAFGDAMSIYRDKTNGTKEAETRARIFATYCYLGLYKLAAKQKYKRYKDLMLV